MSNALVGFGIGCGSFRFAENQNASERILATLTNTLYAPQLSAIMVNQTNLL
jgi:hypothetical protein